MARITKISLLEAQAYVHYFSSDVIELLTLLTYYSKYSLYI